MIEHTVISRSLKRMLRTLRVLSYTSRWKCWVGASQFSDFVDDSLMLVCIHCCKKQTNKKKKTTPKPTLFPPNFHFGRSSHMSFFVDAQP